MYEQMSRSGGQSEARLPVFKFPSKLDTHLSTHCSRDERLSRPCPISDVARSRTSVAVQAEDNLMTRIPNNHMIEKYQGENDNKKRSETDNLVQFAFMSASKSPRFSFPSKIQDDTKQDIIFNGEIIAVVTINEKMPENDEADTIQTPDISQSEGLKAVEIALQYFEQGVSVMDLVFLRHLRDEAAKRSA
ncbi:hypothetical protein TNCV_3418311 [Trichonephila clavipes]|nr:hypothetical protein TNCV_3418311 [Trichonephila clavipes]